MAFFGEQVPKNKQGFGESIRSLLVILLVAFAIRTYFYGLYQVPTPSMETTMLVGERFFADKFTIYFRGPRRGDIVTLNDPEYQYSNNFFKSLWERYVYGPTNWTKRVIGTPGDELKGEIENGVPVIYIKKKGHKEFQKLHEPYLNKYALVPTYRAGRQPHEHSVRSYDPSKSLDEQPFYQFTKAEINRGRKDARRREHEEILYPQRPTYDHRPGYQGRIIDKFHVSLSDNMYWLMGDNRRGSYDSRYWGPASGDLIHGKIVFRIWSLDSEDSWWILDLLRHPIGFWKKVRWSRCMQTVS